MWVRVPPPALREIPANGYNFYKQREAPDALGGGRGSSSSAKGLLHRGSGVLLHVRQHVRVGIQNYGDGGVAEHLRDDLGVYVPAEKECGARVSEIVKTYLRYSSSLQERLESVRRDVAAVQ